jgi:hypothetical protein
VSTPNTVAALASASKLTNYGLQQRMTDTQTITFSPPSKTGCLLALIFRCVCKIARNVISFVMPFRPSLRLSVRMD